MSHPPSSPIWVENRDSEVTLQVPEIEQKSSAWDKFFGWINFLKRQQKPVKGGSGRSKIGIFTLKRYRVSPETSNLLE
jgi:hypothetical protein